MTTKKCLLLIAFSANGRFFCKTLKYGEMINSVGYIDFVK